jgi:hypothetical protein
MVGFLALVSVCSKAVGQCSASRRVLNTFSTAALPLAPLVHQRRH